MKQVLSRFERGGSVQLSRCQVDIAQSPLDGNDLRAQLTHVNNFANSLCSSPSSTLIENKLDISFVELRLNLYLFISFFVCVCLHTEDTEPGANPVVDP